MKIHNSPLLKAWLLRDKRFAELAERDFFTFEDAVFEKAAHIVASHHPNFNQASINIRAALQLLMAGHSGNAPQPDTEKEMIVDSLAVTLPSWVRKWAIAVLILLGVIAFAVIAKAEPEPANAVNAEQIRAALRGNPGLFPALGGGVVIQVKNQGTTLQTRGGGLVVFNCSTNMSCSWSGSTFTLTSSSTASAAWSALTAGTNSNVGTFAASGNTWDFSAATLFKLRVGAGLTSSANGDCGFDSTNNNWHCWNGADRIAALFEGSVTNTDCAKIGVTSSRQSIQDNGGPCPITLASAAHQFLTSYTSTNGLFTQAQPVAADIGLIPGSSGQLLFNNAGAIGAEDPVISYSTPAESTAAWTSATAINTAVSVNLLTAASNSSLSSVMVTLNQGSTITGGVVTFEASDTTAFTNAYPWNCWQTTSGSAMGIPVQSYTFAQSTNQSFICPAASWAAFRVRLSTVISGTGTINVGVQPSAAPSSTVATPNVNPPANTSVNLAQVAGSATATSGAGVQKVGIVGNAGAAVDAAIGAAPPANAIQVGGLGSGLTGGEMISPAVGDTYKNINISTATTTLLITGVAGRQVRITAIHFIAAGADNIALIEGTGATCGTGTAGMAGGTTAATGYNLVANQGYTFGSGLGTVMQTVTAGDSVCAVTSAAVQLSGGIEHTIY